MEKNNLYVAPEVEVIEVEVEKGEATAVYAGPAEAPVAAPSPAAAAPPAAAAALVRTICSLLNSYNYLYFIV